MQFLNNSHDPFGLSFPFDNFPPYERRYRSDFMPWDYPDLNRRSRPSFSQNLNSHQHKPQSFALLPQNTNRNQITSTETPRKNTPKRSQSVLEQKSFNSATILTTDEVRFLGMKDMESFWTHPLDISQLDPETIRITLDELKRTIGVHGSVQTSEGLAISRPVTKAVVVPENVDLGSLSSKMLPNGKLVLLAKREKIPESRIKEERIDDQFTHVSESEEMDCDEIPQNSSDRKEVEKKKSLKDSQNQAEPMKNPSAHRRKKNRGESLSERCESESDHEHEFEHGSEFMDLATIYQMCNIKKPIGDQWPNLE